MNSSVTFYGGAGTVTGANFLFKVAGKKILIDCGILQGKDTWSFNEHFEYDPSDVDILIVTHAHADHIGRVPKLVKDGFRGIIYSHPATFDLAGPMLADAQKLLAQEAQKLGKDPLYSTADINMAFSLWRTLDYYQPEHIVGNLSMRFLDAGHILGSAMVEFERNDKKFVFTGDLGNSPAPLLRDTDKIEDVDYLLMESVYGDRDHEGREERVHKLAEEVARAHKRGGVLLIPAFSMQRTQIILYELNKLIEEGSVPEIPVFLDSPLASKVTDIYRNYTDLFNDRVKNEIANGDDIFDFPKFVDTAESGRHVDINHHGGAKVIISASGMSVGGRILSHESKFLSDKNNTILFVGYQAVHTLGRQIQDGNKTVYINNKKVRVRARIASIHGFSAHKDSSHLVEFVANSANSLKQVFVTMGEPRSALFLTQRLRDRLGVNAIAPELNQTIEVDF